MEDNDDTFVVALLLRRKAYSQERQVQAHSLSIGHMIRAKVLRRFGVRSTTFGPGMIGGDV